MKSHDAANHTTVDQPRKIASPGPVHLEHATILGKENTMYVIATAGGEIRMAAKADGCLLLPEKGDLVLVSLAGNGASHVLNVLSRNDANQEPRSLDLGNDARITAKDGDIGIEGQNLRCLMHHQAHLGAQHLRFEAVEGEASFIRFKLMAQVLQSVAGSAKVVARSLDQRVGRLMQRLGSSYRRIQGMEHVITQRLSLHVRQRLTQKAKNASLEAEENVTINAEHIDLG